MTECIPQVELFSIGKRQVTANAGNEYLSTDAGALLLSRIDRKPRLSERIAAALNDPRDPTRVIHSLDELIRQRLLQIACGYEDCKRKNRGRSSKIRNPCGHRLG